MDRILPEAAHAPINAAIDFVYSYGPAAEKTVVLGESYRIHEYASSCMFVGAVVRASLLYSKLQQICSSYIIVSYLIHPPNLRSRHCEFDIMYIYPFL
mmetsp:Transcript_29016/g.58877  ORF Transcript_29016/g.58877 Transcript_29016/m.58877 type:complete len:98 (-) Transcript_29016:2380-2673(-)